MIASKALASKAARAFAGGAVLPANRSQSAAHRQPAACLSALPAPQSSASGAAARQQRHATQPAGASAAHRGVNVDAAQPLRRPAAGSFVASSGLGAAMARPAAAATSPRVLELQSAAELRHLLACHKRRLLVVHLVATDCPIGEAFLPCLSDACRRYPGALFVRLMLQRPVAASATAVAESQELVEGLHIGRLPCTLLLLGDQLLARLDVGADQAPASAAVAAAITLHEAVAAALRPSAASDEQPAGSEALSFSFAS